MDKPERLRLDQWLVAQGHVPSRARAVALISGGVNVNGKAGRASTMVGSADVVEIFSTDHGYVSRGALKLKAILDKTGACLQGRVVVDIGASTGGFTQLCLERGAQKVYAVDVGQGQLHDVLLADSRVVNLAQTDARALKMLVLVAEVMVMDVSFISATKVLPEVLAAVAGIEEIYLLVKPQFEVGPERVGKGGLVREESARQSALDMVVKQVATLGFQVAQTMPCPVVGGDGNQEYLLAARRRRDF